jgi:hypothetical protein
MSYTTFVYDEGFERRRKIGLLHRLRIGRFFEYLLKARKYTTIIKAAYYHLVKQKKSYQIHVTEFGLLYCAQRYSNFKHQTPQVSLVLAIFDDFEVFDVYNCL